MMRRLPESESIRLLLRAQFGHCPAGCRPLAVINRSSTRSVTFRCGSCRVQWTMTFHMLARSAAVLAERDDCHAGRDLAHVLGEIASVVDDRRGRRLVAA